MRYPGLTQVADGWEVEAEEVVGIPHLRITQKKDGFWTCSTCSTTSASAETFLRVPCTGAGPDPVYVGNEKRPTHARAGDTWEFEGGRFAYAIFMKEVSSSGWWWSEDDRTVCGKVRRKEGRHPLATRTTAVIVENSLDLHKRDLQQAYMASWKKRGMRAMQAWCLENKRIILVSGSVSFSAEIPTNKKEAAMYTSLIPATVTVASYTRPLIGEEEPWEWTPDNQWSSY